MNGQAFHLFSFPPFSPISLVLTLLFSLLVVEKPEPRQTAGEVARQPLAKPASPASHREQAKQPASPGEPLTPTARSASQWRLRKCVLLTFVMASGAKPRWRAANTSHLAFFTTNAPRFHLLVGACLCGGREVVERTRVKRLLGTTDDQEVMAGGTGNVGNDSRFPIKTWHGIDIVETPVMDPSLLTFTSSHALKQLHETPSQSTPPHVLAVFNNKCKFMNIGTESLL